MSLTRVLTLTDLTLFGIISIMGSGGFNLIGTAVQTGGKWWMVACAISATLLLGASHTYSRATLHTKNGDTLESDIVEKMFGRWAGYLSSTGILVFNIVSISVILVICSHMLFPNGKWIWQIMISLTILAGMTIFSLQGIQINKEGLHVSGLALLFLLATTACLGYFGKIFHTKQEPSQVSSTHTFRVSIFTFFFILAGFDVLAKFVDEAKDPSDIPTSFYTSNIISDILTFGIALALVAWSPHMSSRNSEIALENLVGHFLGKTAEEGFNFVIIGFLISTVFVVFLGISRYIYGLGKINTLSFLTTTNENNAPSVAIGIIALLSGIGILINHTNTLVMVSDLGLIMTILLVSAASSVADWRVGNTISALISSLTTAGFGGFLSLYALG